MGGSFAAVWVAGFTWNGWQESVECAVQLITFDEYAVGTTITTQYQPLGVVFSSDGGNPFIALDGANPTSPVLSGNPLFTGPITATFVDPNNSAVGRLASNVQLDAGYFDNLNSVSITYFDINGNVIGSIQNSAYGIEHFTIPGNIHSFTIAAIGNEPAGFAIDNVSFQITPSFVIKEPTVNDTYPLTQNDFRKTAPITFEADDSANTGQVNWTVAMDYATSGGFGSFSSNDTFKSRLNQATTRTYQSEGGRLTINASEPPSSGGGTACPINSAYVVGSAIPDSSITARLDSLYHGPTANLLTGIATVESNYQQFSNRMLYGINSRWPNESYDGGSHIGLMQMPTTEAHAWDWHANTTDAARLFAEKVRTARRLERRIRRQYAGLPRLTRAQVENMALVLYGPYASARLDMQYYTVQVVGTVPQWVVNTANNPGGVNYADNVRQSVR